MCPSSPSNVAAGASPGAGVGKLSMGGRILNGRHFDEEEDEDEGMLDAAVCSPLATAPSMGEDLLGGLHRPQPRLMWPQAPDATAPSPRLGPRLLMDSVGGGEEELAAAMMASMNWEEPRNGREREGGTEEEDEEEVALRESLRGAVEWRGWGCKEDQMVERAMADSARMATLRRMASNREIATHGGVGETAIDRALIREPARRLSDLELETALEASRSLEERLEGDADAWSLDKLVEMGQSLDRLLKMGFERQASIEALLLTGADCHAAIDQLLP